TTTATSFLQDPLTVKPGMKLFPNYTPPIPPHHHHHPLAENGGLPGGGGGGGGPANHHYHQITYQTHQQTLAPLRLNQDHFLPPRDKTNTIGSLGVLGGPSCPRSGQQPAKYQTHHHHHGGGGPSPRGRGGR
ncbi:uncharacterized protein LOC131206466, partial [Anopheles bellator]|uniref:uncharacterized protein LOC131206466 n=1 Tax=Anopheles bellator TaxID=139047 RepID=UPI00264820A8